MKGKVTGINRLLPLEPPDASEQETSPHGNWEPDFTQKATARPLLLIRTAGPLLAMP